MATKREIAVGICLVVAGAVIGSGIGQTISELTGKSATGGPSTIGFGIGFLAAVVYMIMRKK